MRNFIRYTHLGTNLQITFYFRFVLCYVVIAVKHSSK